MFLLRLIWAVVHALFATRADLVAKNLILSHGDGFNVPVHHFVSMGLVVGTRAIGLNQVSGKDRW